MYSFLWSFCFFFFKQKTANELRISDVSSDVCSSDLFRSLAGVVCVLVPLSLVSVFTYAVMVFLDIGVKVSTLPVAAFAAGIGVDYGIYIYSVFEECVME